MNKQIIIYILLFITSANNIFSQRITVTSDSLKNYFRQESSEKVLIYYVNNRSRLINYKELYFDKISKDSLLKWLDEDVIIYEKINQRKKSLYRNFDGEKRKSLTKGYVSYDLKLNFDSIYSNPDLYEFYSHQAISSILDRYKEDILKRKEELIPSYDVLYLHSKIAYPESYQMIKKWWYQNDKKTLQYYRNFTSLFNCLLIMNDPEAQAILDEIISNAIKKEDKMILKLGFIQNIKGIGNCYSVKKLLELLPVQIDIETIPDDPLYPLDLFVFDALFELQKRNDIQGYFIPISQKSNMTIEEEIKYLRNHKKEIVEASQRLIEKLEKEEQYWMENMPFDYIPDLSKE